MNYVSGREREREGKEKNCFTGQVSHLSPVPLPPSLYIFPKLFKVQSTIFSPGNATETDVRCTYMHFTVCVWKLHIFDRTVLNTFVS